MTGVRWWAALPRLTVAPATCEWGTTWSPWWRRESLQPWMLGSMSCGGLPPGSERTLLQRAERHEQNSGLSPSCCKAREKRLSRDYLHGMAHDLKCTTQIMLGVDLCAWMSRCIRKCHVSNKIHLLFRIRWFQNAFLCSHTKNTSAQFKNTPGSFLSQNKKKKNKLPWLCFKNRNSWLGCFSVQSFGVSEENWKG